jgi:superfamily II DNA/RNA helicase
VTSPLEQLPNTYRPFFGRFSSLTTAQKALIQPILTGQDVVLQAGTGTGKTEGVLAPATERLIAHSDHFTILYIVPTRALALDMNRRIKPLYKQLGLKSGIRTGDGKTLQGGKPHLLILTPESLDVLLGSQNLDNKHFLKHLHVMIIDEVHLFLRETRGYQLSFLRRRIEMQSNGTLQTIALSATISDPEEVSSFFKLKNVFYYKQAATRRLQPCWVHLEDEGRELVPFFDDLLLRWKCQKLLVFANSRKKCEQLFDLLNQEGFFSQNVLLHYSNLSTKERRSIESAFRNNKRSVCIATSTLEMGIDIGDVDGVVLIGPPPSTMAFLQRIGRGNRRQQHVNFWGVCLGADAGRQLVRFLALFELAKENQLEKLHAPHDYSVLFQQILSCLYAKKTVSQKALNVLFNQDQTADWHSIFHEMLVKNWLKPMPQPGLFHGGWRYVRALKQQKIWSNFPPTDEEYDVILEQNKDKIADLPLSAVRQLEIGDLIQLTGKVLKVLRIEEKKASREVWVEESNASANKEFFWVGFGAPTSFEVAQKMGTILLEKRELQGLLSRARRLLEEARDQIGRSISSPKGIRVHQLLNGAYRYETFLGSTGNFILHHLIRAQLVPKIEGLSVRFDEMGIESNQWIPFESLEFPYTIDLFEDWVSSHLPLLREAFSWNSWMYWLPKDLQSKEISSRLLDLRVLDCFKCYHKERASMTPPQYLGEVKEAEINQIPLKGDPWSLENEKQDWGRLLFPEILSEPPYLECSLTATQIQGYVTQNLCARWARFQHLNYIVDSHPRFRANDQETQPRQQQGIAFKKQVIEELQNKHSVCWETKDLTWKGAVEEVISSQKPLFLAHARLQVDREIKGILKGSPDLIYLKHQGSHICLEVWDIKNGSAFTYAQKWRIAFYAYLLEILLKEESFLLPVEVSALGGLVYRHADQEKLFDRTPFSLAPYKSQMSRLIAQWESDSMQSSAVQSYSMNSSCTSCRYFSYCYQETLFHPETAPIESQMIVPLGIDSNDFPKNSKHWFFIDYDKESIRWQCWDHQGPISGASMHSKEYCNKRAFQEAVANQLQKEWRRSVEQGKNPHFLVYESADWHSFRTAFQSTPLQSLWAMHVSWTSIQSVLQEHFLWPIYGRLTATQVGLCLGLVADPSPPLSFYHRESPLEVSLDLYRHIWSWCLAHVKSRRLVSFDFNKMRSVPLINAYLAMQHREGEYRTHAILEFQKNPLSKRVEDFRSIGPLTFLDTVIEGKQKCYRFSIAAESPVSKFRAGDFLKLSPVGSSQIQSGLSVVLESYSPEEGTLSVRPLSQKMTLCKQQLYALDEDASDWNAPKIERVLNQLKDPRFRPELIQMLLGKGKSFSSAAACWVDRWYSSEGQNAGLNRLQKEALMLPFRENIGLIEGPPGTGKTHLLVWTLLALVAYAKYLNRPVKILVTAQTHQSIDQILRKVANLIPKANVGQVSLLKCGRYDQARFPKLGIHPLQESQPLYQNASLIFGATGFGVYQLLEGKNFPQLFDWVVFDESSQLLPSYALLSLIFGKGNALFYGDTQQLPPVLMGHYDHTSYVPQSILKELTSRYGRQNRLRLNETYRLNEDICGFASQHWYDGELRSAVPKNKQRLELSCYPLYRDLLDDHLDPSKSMAVVQLEHEGCRQSSQEEALWIAKAVKRLIEDYSVSSDEIGIISPHRLQNNAISCALHEALSSSLKMPKIDTVERMQGLEFDIVIFSATVSDKEIIHSAFLKDYRRFNVALTRSRKKFLLVASALFFQSFPTTEKELLAHMPFEAFFALHSFQQSIDERYPAFPFSEKH